jgi:cell wall-associated NlpC family hydrolase
MLARSRWRTRGRAARAVGIAVVTTAVTASLIALPLAAPAAATPSDQPGGTSGVLDSKALDELQRRAAQVQTGLKQQQGQVEQARQAQQEAEAAVAAAQKELGSAESELARQQREVATYAAAIYRDGGSLTPLTLLLSGTDPSDVIAAMGYMEAVDAHAAQVIGAAETRRQAALAEQRRAAAALAEAKRRAAGVSAKVAELEKAAAAVTDQLDQALSVVDKQLAALQKEQIEVNAQTAANWRSYVQQLTDAGLAPPPAAALLNPAASLPAGLVPIAAHAGGAQRGAAQLPRQPNSLLVLPAQTIAAVSAAMDALGKPYAPGTAGPNSWDCGSLVQKVYAGAGIALPGTQGDLFATSTPIDRADVLPGDLVFLGAKEAGLSHVGIALDPKTMVAADARAGAVVVRTLPADQVLQIGRPTLGQRAPVAAPGPTGGALKAECGNTVYPPSYDGSRAWGGYPNGLIPPSALCSIGVAGHMLRCDAAAAWKAMSAAFAGVFGTPMCITDSYRPYVVQVRLYGQKPALAAVPGTSNHGWGLAVDLCGGIDHYGTSQYNWMLANAGRFGWLHPTWADPGNGREEPWHWEYATT